MSDANTPTPQLFIIQSRIGNRDWVLTVRNKAAPASTDTTEWSNEDCEVRLAHNAYSDAQLWVQEMDSRGGFFLRAVGLQHSKNPQGSYLRASKAQGVGSPTLAAKTMDDPELIWRKENDQEWGCLNKLVDWEQKLQVKGNGPYDEKSELCCYEYDRGAEHELWKLVPYNPTFSSTKIVYKTPQVAKGAPITASAQEYVNNTKEAQTYQATLEASREKSYSHSISNTSTKTHEVGVELGLKYKYKELIEVDVRGSYKYTTSEAKTIGEEKRVTETISASASALVTVPAGKTYEVALMLNECSLTAGYTASMTRLKPDGKPGATYTIEGEYAYTGSYGFRIEVWDVTGDKREDVTKEALAKPKLEMA